MPNALIDLHMHTHYSDGRTSPAEVLRHAAGLGLKTIAITDHDNLNAYDQAQHVASELGLDLLPGIELTTHWDRCPRLGHHQFGPQDVDLLGCAFDLKNTDLAAFTHAAMKDVHARSEAMCQLLNAAGYPLTIFNVLDENQNYPGARQIIEALWHRGYAADWNAAYTLFVSQWPKMPACAHSIEQAIAVLHAAGGVAVLAHPVAIDCSGEWLQSEQLAALVDAGLDGIEILHPRQDAAARQYFSTLAHEFDLLITGGSDEHGWQGGFSRLGSELVTYPMVKALRNRASLYR